MNSPQLERLISAALHKHAEDAMNETDTEHRLHDLLREGEHENENSQRRRVWVAGAAAAVVALVAGIAWWQGPGQRDTTPDPIDPVPQMNSAEQLAADFATAIFAFDRDEAATYLAEEADVNLGSPEGPEGWIRLNRWWEATRLHGTVDSCHQNQALTPEGASVGCLFTYSDMGSEELNRGPFTDNLVDVTIHNGAITEASITFADDLNGFVDVMWEPFYVWLDSAHPNTSTQMEMWSLPESSEAEVRESLALWERFVEEYVDAVKAGEAE